MKNPAFYSAVVLSLALGATCTSKQAFAQGFVLAGGAETDSAPASAYFNGNVYLAWKNYQNVMFTYAPPGIGLTSSSTPAYSVPGAQTAQAPALAIGGFTPTLYIAWTRSNGQISYSALSGSSFGTSSDVCFSAGNCAQTVAAPALASFDGLIYLAWTTASHNIMLASYSGSGYWTLIGNGIPGASTALAPALAASSDRAINGALYAAWVTGTNIVEYASLPASGGSWSGIGQVPNAQTNAAPALGNSLVPVDAGLYVAWAASGSTFTGFQTYYALLNPLNGLWSQPLPVLSSESAQYPTENALDVTPTLLSYRISSSPSSSVYCFADDFDVFYISAYNQIYWSNLQTKTICVHKPSPV